MLRRGFLYSLNNNTAPPYEAETIAHMTAIGITDNATMYGTKTGHERWVGLNNCLVALKDYSLFTGIRCLIPTLGNSTTMWERDLMESNNLVFAGSPGGDYVGWTRNGVNQSASLSGLAGSQMLSHFHYFASDASEAVIDFNANSGSQKCNIYARYPGDITYGSVQNASSDEMSFTNTNAIGLYGCVRGSSTKASLWKDAVKKFEDITSNYVAPDAGGIQYTDTSTKKVGFTCIFKEGVYLTDTDVVNFMTTIITFLDSQDKLAI